MNEMRRMRRRFSKTRSHLAVTVVVVDLSEGNDSAPIETLEVLARVVERGQLRPDTPGSPGLSEAQQAQQAGRDSQANLGLHFTNIYLVNFLQFLQFLL